MPCISPVFPLVLATKGCLLVEKPMCGLLAVVCNSISEDLGTRFRFTFALNRLTWCIVGVWGISSPSPAYNQEEHQRSAFTFFNSCSIIGCSNMQYWNQRRLNVGVNFNKGHCGGHHLGWDLCSPSSLWMWFLIKINGHVAHIIKLDYGGRPSVYTVLA